MKTGRVKNRLPLWIATALGLCLFVLQAQATALDPFAADKKSALVGETAFLPVEQAFQISARIQDQQLLLDWIIAPDYYLYRERIKVHLAENADGKPLAFEAGTGINKYDDNLQRDTEVFYGQAQLSLPLSALPTSVFTLQVESQGCADAGLCYPPRTQFFTIKPASGQVTETTAAAVAPSPALPAPPSPDADPLHRWASILLMALLGGLILNLMPCVFPVLSLKVFAMAGHGDHSRTVRRHSWIYAAGVILSFVIVAALMLALRAAGESAGWGFQLQEPLFVSLLVYLFFVLGLSFSGIVHLGGSLMGAGQRLVAGNGTRSAFFTGVLAVVVASPCSAPFMGVALGYAVTQSAPLALLVFAVLGLGMALPFVLLAYWPQFLRRLPAPGAWMERLRQFLAFPLYASGVWLLYVLGQQAGQAAILWLLCGLILLVMAGWLWRDAHARWWEKSLAVIALLVALMLPLMMSRNNDPSIAGTQTLEKPYSAAHLAALRAEGKSVLVNLTAAWCITCFVNEKTALNRSRVKAHLRTRGITYLKGDWTHRDPEITRLLSDYGRNGVPLYLYFPPGKESKAQVLPQVLTEDGVLQILK